MMLDLKITQTARHEAGGCNMLNRIYANNFENTYFPLRDPNTQFPNDLLVGISILVPDHSAALALYYVSVKGSEVTVSVGRYTDGTLTPYASCTSRISEHRVANLLYESDGNPIGFVCFGSGVNRDGEYIGPVNLDPMCYAVDTDNTVSNINGSPVHTPEAVRIRVAGALSPTVSKNTCTLLFNHSVDGFLLDGRDRGRFGCISTVNGSPIPDNTLTITLPEGFSVSSSVFKSSSICDQYRGNALDRVIITIEASDIYDDKYGCSSEDPILAIFSSADKFNGTKQPLEKPLDRYIDAYRNWRNGVLHRTEDTISIDGVHTYTYGDDNDYIFSDPTYLSDAVSISYGDNEVVLVKSGDESWEE